MSHDLGMGVSKVYNDEGYNYSQVVFQKGKPPLDSELNYLQQIQNIIDSRKTIAYPSGWLSMYPVHTSTLYENYFYTQDSSNARPEFALIGGKVIHVTYTESTIENSNKIELGNPPFTGNVVNGVFLEVWDALLDPDDSTNKPDPSVIIDELKSIHSYDLNKAWVCGQNGLILRTDNAGQTWSVLLINTKQILNDIYFVTDSIGWVVGDGGLIARTASAGGSWSILSSGTSENLNAVYARNQLIAWTVGNSGCILKTTNGVSWFPVYSGVTENLNSIHFYDTLIGWAVGDSGRVIKTTDGGSNWRVISTLTVQNLRSVFFYNQQYGFIVGDKGTILLTSDGGESWVSQSGNIWNGSEYTTTTKNLHRVVMRPSVDSYANNEEVSSQLIGKANFSVTNFPITIGDGNGTVTNDPRSVKVLVDGVEVAVDNVDGLNGTVTLAEIPGLHATVKVSYWYRTTCAIFRGQAWIVGEGGTLLYTENVGSQWVYQNSQTSYNLNGISFVDQDHGWLVGENSVIRYTGNGGSVWSSQRTETFSRRVQRVFFEGNIKSSVYLSDESIHPDLNVETTKRVQTQYCIRVLNNADPVSNPEAGISTSVLGIGPNSIGEFPYENMGPINGDYGLWRAKCNNTVTGYCYAIPMFFVARRNTSPFNPETNINGSYEEGGVYVRPDLLKATMITESDILDVRRRIVIPSIEELLIQSFNYLSNNILRTRLGVDSVGGDQYGTEILRIDRIGGTSSDGGFLIDGTILQAAEGAITSEASFSTLSIDVTATEVVPSDYVLSAPQGLFHSNPVFFSAIYVSPGSVFNGKAVPGYFEGFGTTKVRFVFNSNANSNENDPNLSYYRISASYFVPGTGGLSYIPSTPCLVLNSGGGDEYFNGINSTSDSNIIKVWNSSVSGYNNYSKVLPAKDASNVSQQVMSSLVEVHFFMKISVSDLVLGTPPAMNKLKINLLQTPYSIFSIKRIVNVTANFSYKISSMSISGSVLTVTPASGYNFIEGSIIEIIAPVLSASTSVDTGSTVNFNPWIKGINKFTMSKVRTVSGGSLILSNEEILGICCIETPDSLNQSFGFENGIMVPLTVTGFGTSTLTVQESGTFTVQLLTREMVLPNPDVLLIGYRYIPYQSQVLPNTLIVDIVSIPDHLYVSNLGTGGGDDFSPYLNPLYHIPLNNSVLSGEGFFHNFEPMRFSDFVIHSGFAQLPIHVPAGLVGPLTLSSPAIDSLGRSYYSVCSSNFVFEAEGLQLGVARKVYIPVIARVNSGDSNSRFTVGEYLLLIFSRSYFVEKENITGYSDYPCTISIYRLPNRPISRI